MIQCAEKVLYVISLLFEMFKASKTVSSNATVSQYKKAEISKYPH